MLRRAADIIRDRNHELSVLETLDTGKPLQETLVADAASGADCLEYFGGLIATDTTDHIPLGGSAGSSFAYTRREPLGVVRRHRRVELPDPDRVLEGGAGAGGRQRDDLQAVGGDAAQRARSSPTILVEAGLPAGAFNVLQGAGDVGAALVAHPGVAKVSVTGSVPTGERVAATAAPGLKHVTLELGGKSPLIVFDDAHLDNAVSGAMLGNFYSTGQVCSNGTRVFVQRGVYDEFVARRRGARRADRARRPARRVDPDGAAGERRAARQGDRVRARRARRGRAPRHWWRAAASRPAGGLFVAADRLRRRHRRRCASRARRSSGR